MDSLNINKRKSVIVTELLHARGEWLMNYYQYWSWLPSAADWRNKSRARLNFWFLVSRLILNMTPLPSCLQLACSETLILNAGCFEIKCSVGNRTHDMSLSALCDKNSDISNSFATWNKFFQRCRILWLPLLMLRVAYCIDCWTVSSFGSWWCLLISLVRVCFFSIFCCCRGIFFMSVSHFQICLCTCLWY
jgi:hypothetical protein